MSAFNQPTPISIENISKTTAGPKTLLDVAVYGSGIAGVATVYNVNMTSAGTEYSFSIPIGTKKFLLKTRLLSTLQYTFQSGQSGTTFMTLEGGNSYSEDNMALDVALPIYFQSNKPLNVLEITIWA